MLSSVFLIKIGPKLNLLPYPTISKVGKQNSISQLNFNKEENFPDLNQGQLNCIVNFTAFRLLMVIFIYRRLFCIQYLRAKLSHIVTHLQ